MNGISVHKTLLSINNTLVCFTLQNPHVESLLNMFMNLSRDEDEDVRNNAVFGAGELALHGGQVRHLFQSNNLSVISSCILF
jgi:hypothetical protein